MEQGTAGPRRTVPAWGTAVFYEPLPLGPSRLTPKVLGAYKRAVLRDPCAYCGGAATVLDHIRSRREGGRSGWLNLAAACDSCNCGKSHRSLLSLMGMRRWRSDWQAMVEQRSRWSALGRRRSI